MCKWLRMGFQPPGMQPFDCGGLFRPQELTTAPPLCWVSFFGTGYGTGGGNRSYEVPVPNFRRGRNPWAPKLPGKHWQELGSLGPWKRVPFAHGLKLGPSYLSPWARDSGTDCAKGKIMCQEGLDPIPEEALGAMRASKGSPVPPHPKWPVGVL